MTNIREREREDDSSDIFNDTVTLSKLPMDEDKEKNIKNDNGKENLELG